GWHDNDHFACGSDTLQRPYIIEWSADCNGDGIVDYGQILDGSLADSNGNGIPDCCDEGTCLPPAQWRVEDGGNGHWYQLVETDLTDGLLDQLQDQLAASGANLVSIEDQAEQDHVVGLSAGLPGWTALGAKIMTSVPCDATSWEWFDAPSPDTRIEFTAWDVESEQPDCGGSEYIATWGVDVEQPLVNAGLWHDVPGTSIRYTVIEWSADCNGDNIVDYGQILDGTLADSNGNGIPDCCDVGTCLQLSADINDDGCIDGIDLTFILGFWGPVEPGSFESTVDLNQDGVINGNDLARLLSDWSPCP
ncbi:MAG: dockerin type I domain-containing protein, partial [Myxococcota bacterium]|nr:dockerin type I domain-containing protein [Myxococcota bacterium]